MTIFTTACHVSISWAKLIQPHRFQNLVQSVLHSNKTVFVTFHSLHCSTFFPFELQHAHLRLTKPNTGFDVLLTVHLSIFISVINQLDARIFFYNKFISCLYMFRAPCAHHQEVKILLYSLWYHHTETSEWSKINKIQFYKYEQIVVKFMCEFFGCDYCVLLTVNMLCHVEVMFIQLLNLYMT